MAFIFIIFSYVFTWKSKNALSPEGAAGCQSAIFSSKLLLTGVLDSKPSCTSYLVSMGIEMNWNLTRFRGFTLTIHKRVSKGIKRVCRILSNNITTLVYVQHQSFIWHSAWPHFLATLHRSAVGWEAARLLLPLSHQITMLSKNLSSSSHVYFYLRKASRRRRRYVQVSKIPTESHAPLFARPLLGPPENWADTSVSHRADDIWYFMFSCKAMLGVLWLAPLSDLACWAGASKTHNPMASAQSFNGWIWTTSMSGLLDCWNPATIGFDPNLFTSKAPIDQKKSAVDFRAHQSDFFGHRPKKKKFHLQFTTQDWIEIHHTRTLSATLSPI